MNLSSNTLAHVLDQISNTPDLPLLFSLDDRQIGNGYHITEIKLANIDSVDCGKGRDKWQEIIIQLLDGASENPAMKCRQFNMIMNQALTGLKPSENARLLFEFSLSNGPLQRLQVRAISNQTDSRLIELGASKAECKPFARALANSFASVDQSEFKTARSSCCGGSSRLTQRSCC